MIINNIKLLIALVRNIRSKAMNRKMIGYSVRKICPPVTSGEAVSFAEATLDNNIAFYKRTGIAPPFFVSKLIMPVMKKIMMHKDLKMNLLRLVHSSQEITWYSHLKTGDRLTLELRISDISDSAKGELISISVTGTKENIKVLEGTVNIMIRGTRQRKAEQKKEKPDNKSELFRLSLPTRDGQQKKYARITGDNNFIHTSNLIAKAAGLPCTIMHGACVMAMTSNALTASLIHNDINQLHSISVRFSYPVVPGEILELVCYKGKEKNEVLFNLLNSKGREVLKDGIFRFK